MRTAPYDLNDYPLFDNQFCYRNFIVNYQLKEINACFIACYINLICAIFLIDDKAWFYGEGTSATAALATGVQRF